MRPARRLVCGVLSLLLGLFALGSLACSSVHGRRDVDYSDPDFLPTPLRYECVGMDLFLVDDVSPREVRVTEAKTCTPRHLDPYVMTYSVRREDGDHFFVWNDEDDHVVEFVVPLDRRRDAEMRRYDAEVTPRTHRVFKSERGMDRVEGAPAKKWTCWSHAPGAEELRGSTP